jgi:hypothetical protein
MIDNGGIIRNEEDLSYIHTAISAIQNPSMKKDIEERYGK